MIKTIFITIPMRYYGPNGRSRYDYCDSGEAEYLQYNEDEDMECIIEDRILGEVEQLRFLLTCQFKYRHFTVQDLAVYDDPDDPDYGSCRRNRVVCYSDGVGFDYHNLIHRQIHGTRVCDVSFVSFDNECIRRLRWES